MNNELDKLKECFSNDEISDSWYYLALQHLNEKANGTAKKTQRNIIKFNEENSELTESKIIEESIDLVESNLFLDWINFILKYKNNPYFSNIIKQTIYIIKQTIKNDFFDENLINEFGFSSFELTISQNIINKFFIKKINLFNINEGVSIVKMI